MMNRMCLTNYFQKAIDKLASTNTSGMLVSTSSWKDQFLEAMTIGQCMVEKIYVYTSYPFLENILFRWERRSPRTACILLAFSLGAVESACSTISSSRYFFLCYNTHITADYFASLLVIDLFSWTSNRVQNKSNHQIMKCAPLISAQFSKLSLSLTNLFALFLAT